MSNQSSGNIGNIEWQDLTIVDAKQVGSFYSQVVGWQIEPVSMGDYDDYNVNNASGDTVAGVCHARGYNQTMPAQWLLYVRVADVEVSAAKTVELGGKVIVPCKAMGKDQMCVIEDPAGAVIALVSASS